VAERPFLYRETTQETASFEAAMLQTNSFASNRVDEAVRFPSEQPTIPAETRRREISAEPSIEPRANCRGGEIAHRDDDDRTKHKNSDGKVKLFWVGESRWISVTRDSKGTKHMAEVRKN